MDAELSKVFTWCWLLWWWWICIRACFQFPESILSALRKRKQNAAESESVNSKTKQSGNRSLLKDRVLQGQTSWYNLAAKLFLQKKLFEDEYAQKKKLLPYEGCFEHHLIALMV